MFMGWFLQGSWEDKITDSCTKTEGHREGGRDRKEKSYHWYLIKHVYCDR